MKTKSNLSLRWGFLTLFLLVFSSVLPAQSGRGWVKGIVLGVSDSQGMSGAVVEMTGDWNIPTLRDVSLKAVTDERGRYSFKDVPYGAYTFEVSAPGYISYEAQVYIPSDAETQLHVRLRMELEEQEDIQRQFIRFQRALSSKDTATIDDLYLEGAVSLLQNQAPRKSREAITARWKKAFAAPFSLILTSLEIKVSPGGHDAYQYGTFEIHASDSNASLLATGKWLYLWRWESDVWRIALEMDNFDAPTPKAPSPR